jgi:glutamine cyclotransferase
LKSDDYTYVVSCGGYGSSEIRLLSGFDDEALISNVVYKAPREYFFEGCALLPGDRLVVLTWRNKKILEFHSTSFQLIREVDYPYDGWGLTFDPDHNELVATDGSDRMFFLEPSTLSVTRSCQVRLTHNGISYISVRYMNELEYMHGLIYANIYIPAGVKGAPNYIVGVNPDSCIVEKILPFSITAGSPGRVEHVMNGIAEWGSDSSRFLVSGKMWNKIYLVTETRESPSLAHNITKFLAHDLYFR